ncbi:MAG TPA: type II secretion system F family protein [Planctomycetes bacterium]|nr:type II secretion system F family protein [Planctomycetota bacterium]
MNNFAYRVRDLAGEEKTGYRRAASGEEVYAWLHNKGLIPIEVIPVTSSPETKDSNLGYKEPKYAELAAFCWQLATMLDGGVLITTAIETIAEDIENLRFRHALLSVGESIKKGESLSSSISRFPKVFNNLFCTTILAGETSGSLPLVLRRLGDYYTRRDKFAKKIQTALAYPVFVVSFVFVLLIIMMVLIIPRFRMIFEQMGNKLPAFTQGFMHFYDVVASHSLLIIISMVSFVVLFIIYNKTQEGHTKLCRLALSVPLVGKIASQAFIATFCRTMATLLSAGVSIIESFDILSEMTNNVVIRNAVVHSKENLIEGSGVSTAMVETGFFPSMVTRMVQVGERSGTLPVVLERASDYYETKMDTTITTLLNLLGPIVIVIVGVGVLVVVVALYLPIFSMSDSAFA